MFKINASGNALDVVYEQAHRYVYRVYEACNQWSLDVTTGDQSGEYVVEVFRSLINYRDRLNEIKTTPGIGQYAKTIVDDPAYDIAAEFTAVINSISGAISWIHDNYPKSNDYWLIFQTDATGTVTARVFTPAQLSGLSGQLGNILATIEVT